jgi:hypothetical protein
MSRRGFRRMGIPAAEINAPRLDRSRETAEYHPTS